MTMKKSGAALFSAASLFVSSTAFAASATPSEVEAKPDWLPGTLATDFEMSEVQGTSIIWRIWDWLVSKGDDMGHGFYENGAVEYNESSHQGLPSSGDSIDLSGSPDLGDPQDQTNAFVDPTNPQLNEAPQDSWSESSSDLPPVQSHTSTTSSSQPPRSVCDRSCRTIETDVFGNAVNPEDQEYLYYH